MIRTIGAALFAAALFATPALAEGPGTYSVRGKQGGSDAYTGTATLSQTGKDTWRLVWNVGGERYEGFGIGDGKVLSFTFTNGKDTGAALYVSDDAGGYSGRWAFRGDTQAGTETLKPR